MSIPRIAVGPHPGEFATDAVRAGGGTVVGIDDAPDGVVWLDPHAMPALEAWLVRAPSACTLYLLATP